MKALVTVLIVLLLLLFVGFGVLYLVASPSATAAAVPSPPAPGGLVLNLSGEGFPSDRVDDLIRRAREEFHAASTGPVESTLFTYDMTGSDWVLWHSVSVTMQAQLAQDRAPSDVAAVWLDLVVDVVGKDDLDLVDVKVSYRPHDAAEPLETWSMAIDGTPRWVAYDAAAAPK